MSLMKTFLKRQTTTNPNNNNGSNDVNNDVYDPYGGWWYSPVAYAIKWAIVGAIFIFFLTFFVGGYLHAKRRMKKGLAPLRYHRWLVPRRHLLVFYSAHPHLPSPYANQYQGPNAYYRPGVGEQRSYPMGPMGQAGYYGPPPPAYGEAEYVPPYAPPEGASKAAPDQTVRVATSTQETGVVGTGASSRYPGGDLGQRQEQR